MNYMNHFIKSLFLLLVTISFSSCSDDFIEDKLKVNGVSKTGIIISPEAEAADYQFDCGNIIDGDFKIVSKPDWLVIESTSGKFSDGLATIHGFAKVKPEFSRMGIHIEQMVITSNGRDYVIPVYYVVQGDPSFRVEYSLTAYNPYNYLKVSNLGAGVLIWDIVSMPRWLSVNTSQLDDLSVVLGPSATSSVPLVIDIEAAEQDGLNGTITFKTNDKKHPIVQIAVSVYMGFPYLSLSNDRIDYERTESSRSIQIRNDGSGPLTWSFEEVPEWLTISQSSGKNMANTYSDITFTCDRGKLPIGSHSTVIKLKSNFADRPSIDITVTLRVAGIPDNVREIEGNVVRAAFDKNTNVLYYATSEPNKLVAYDVTTKTILHEITLSKAPTCLTIKEDFNQALIGFNEMVSIVDLSSYTIVKSIEVADNVYDVEWGDDEWFCYSVLNSMYSTPENLHWININSGETFETITPDIKIGAAYLNKVPNQPYIIASSKDNSPTGIYVFDINTKAYKSRFYDSSSDIWFFDGGEMMITGYSDVFRTSTLTSLSGDNIPAPSKLGQIRINYSYSVPHWVDISTANHCIYALLSNFPGSSSSPEKGVIHQFSSVDYTIEKTYNYECIFQPNLQTPVLEVYARYVFANRQGTELTILRKGNDTKLWSIEFIPV